MEYLYEMHLHTSPCSKCADATMREMVDGAAAAGLSGFVVTNHFFRGNTGIDRALPWDAFVGAYIDDYAFGRAYGKERGIDVLFGLEQGYAPGKEVLLYGLSPEVILSHPEMRQMPLSELSEFTHRHGGLIYHAHPFRSRAYIPDPDTEPDPALLDGVEVINAGNEPERNAIAAAYAKKYRLPGIAGSDAHTPGGLGKAGLIFDHRISDNAALHGALRAGAYRIIDGDRILPQN